MTRLGKITRMISAIVAEITSIGGTTQNRIISPKGLYYRPVKDEKTIIIPLSKGNNQDIVFVLQDEKELDEGDVMLTDNKSTIHFHFNGDTIEIKTGKMELKTDLFEVTAAETTFSGNVSIGGDLNVDGDANIGGSLGVDGDGSVTGSLVAGEVTVGAVAFSTHLHQVPAPISAPTEGPISPPSP